MMSSQLKATTFPRGPVPFLGKATSHHEPIVIVQLFASSANASSGILKFDETFCTSS
jgi:hypothetical protein